MAYPKSFPSGYQTVSPVESKINKKPKIFRIFFPLGILSYYA